MDKPSQSFSQCMGSSFRQTVAGIFSRKDMNESIMLEGHVASTLARAKASDSQYLIASQDTTYYIYQGHQAMQGLGFIQGKVRGLLQHNVLLLDEQGLSLGLIDQQYWTRQGGRDLSDAATESEKWHWGLLAVNQHLSSLDKKVVLVQDREADIFEFIRAQRSDNVEILLRVHEPRNMEISATGYVGKLSQVAQHLPEYGYKEVIIRRNNREVRLTLALRAGKIHLHPTKDLSVKKHQIENLSLVIAQEVDCIDIVSGESIFDAEEAAIWHLLSSLPIDDISDIERIVRFYSLRWTVEVFHYTMKSGALNVEKLQFDDIDSLINALAFYSVVAWQLLALTFLVRTCPDAPATTFAQEAQIQLLKSVSGAKKIITIGEYILSLGKLVGFARSKKQPFPGVKVMAKALECFYFIQIGAKIITLNEHKYQTPTR